MVSRVTNLLLGPSEVSIVTETHSDSNLAHDVDTEQLPQGGDV
jgi:hypothetical protein